MAKPKSLLLFSITLLFTISSTSQWIQTGGPAGADAHEIVEVGNTLVLSARNGGIYRSLDKGNSWVLSISGLPDNPYVLDIYVDSDIIYAGIGNNGLYKSLDHGNTWIASNTGLENASFYVVFAEGPNIYAADSNGGVYFSPDAGASWIDKKEGISHIQVHEITSFNSKVYIGGSSFIYPGTTFLYGTSDYGDTWEGIDIPGIDLNGVGSMTVHDGVLYVGTVGQVFVSTNDLESWQQTPLNTFASIITLNSSNGVVYATSSKGKYYETNDVGSTWKITQNTSTKNFVQDILFTEDKIVMTTGEDGVYESIDNGVSWSRNTEGLKGLEISAITKDDTYIYAGTRGQGILRSGDEGQTWTHINNGIEAIYGPWIHDIITFDNSIFISTYSGVYESRNNGDYWERILDPGLYNGNGPLSFDNGIFATTVAGKGVFISSDMGQTWNQTPSDGLEIENDYSSIFIQGSTIVIAQMNSKIFISTDLGQSWSDISLPGGYYHTYKIKIQNNELYASTTQGLLVSNDLGQNWHRFIPYDQTSIQDIVVNGDVVYAATENGVQVSQKGRKQWYSMTDGMGEKWISDLFLADDILYAGTSSSSLWSRPISEIGVPPLDDDNDGIANESDLCPNTALGVPVNSTGCDLIAPDAIRVYTATPSCPDVANGSIEISTSLTADYGFTIKMVGEGRDERFTDIDLDGNFKLDDLAPGTYEITVSIPEVLHEQLFGITINNSSSISGKLQGTDTKSKSAKYIVSGSTAYTVEVNGLQTRFTFNSVEENEISLHNLQALNTITISGENDCQGKFIDTLSLEEVIQVYPTITSGLLSVTGGLEITEILIYDMSGQLMSRQKTGTGTPDTVRLDNYTSGLYIIHVKTREKNNIFKVIKK